MVRLDVLKTSSVTIALFEEVNGLPLGCPGIAILFYEEDLA